MEKKSVELLKFMNERAKTGVNYAPEDVVKKKMRESPLKLKQRVTKAMKTALGMRESIMIKKRERIKRKNMTERKNESYHGICYFFWFI